MPQADYWALLGQLTYLRQAVQGVLAVRGEHEPGGAKARHARRGGHTRRLVQDPRAAGGDLAPRKDPLRACSRPEKRGCRPQQRARPRCPSPARLTRRSSAAGRASGARGCSAATASRRRSAGPPPPSSAPASPASRTSCTSSSAMSSTYLLPSWRRSGFRSPRLRRAK